MTTHRRFRISNFAEAFAVVSAACLFVAAASMIIAATITAITAFDRIAEQKQLVERMEGLVEQRRASLASNSEGNAEQALLAGNSASLAAANLQEFLVSELASIGIAPTTIEIRFPPAPEAMPATINRVQLQADIDFSEGDLANLLQSADAMSPVLLIDEFFFTNTARRSAGNNQSSAENWQTLSGRIVVSGFWTNVPSPSSEADSSGGSDG